MPTNRRRRTRSTKQRITPEAIAAYKADDYGRLHDALGLKPWEFSPLWARGENPPEGEGEHRAKLWLDAKAWRDELERAIADERGNS